MHILFLTDNFPPEVNAPATRTYEHCREWVEAGHQVTVITCVPNFPQGKVHDGYKNRFWQSEWVDGIRVVRVWSYITANEGVFRRSIDYVSYMFSAVLAAPFVRRVDLVIGTSPQFFTACAAYVISRYKRVPFVFELRDLWPDSIKAVEAMGNTRLLRQMKRLELFLYKRSTTIISVTHSFKQILVQRGVNPHKIEVVTNGADVDRFQPQAKDSELEAKYGLRNDFVVGYIGTLGMAHGLVTVLDAAAQLQDNPTGQRFSFLILGDGAMKARLVEEAAERELDNIAFIDSVPKDQVARYWSLLDVSIIHLKRHPLFTAVIPSKLFESMAMGVPVVHGVEGESLDLVKSEDIGLTFEPENTAALCDCLMKLADDAPLRSRFRAKCRKAALKYDRRALANKMLGILEQTVSRERSLESH